VYEGNTRREKGMSLKRKKKENEWKYTSLKLLFDPFFAVAGGESIVVLESSSFGECRRFYEVSAAPPLAGCSIFGCWNHGMTW
jgi:hypothetical protein